MSRAIGSRRCAAAVGTTERVVRSSRVVPTRSSKRLICVLIVDWLVPSRRAAREKLRDSATATRAWSRESGSSFIA